MSFSINRLLGAPQPSPSTTSTPMPVAIQNSTSTPITVTAPTVNNPANGFGAQIPGAVPGQGTTPSAPNGAPPALAANIAVHSASGYGQNFQLPMPHLSPTGPNYPMMGMMQNNLGHTSGLGAGFTMNPWMYNPLLALQQLNQVQQTKGDMSELTQQPEYVSFQKGKRPSSSKEGNSPSKKTRYFAEVSSSSENEDDEEELAESFDPASFYGKSSKSVLPAPIGDYVKTHFRSCLAPPLRKAMAKDDPLPNSQFLKCLQADDDIVHFAGKDFPKVVDNKYKRIQPAVLASAAPCLNLWKNLSEQGMTNYQNSLVPVETVMDMIQRSVVLVGNASNYISQVRRDHTIFHMGRNNSGLAQTLKSVCKKHAPKDDLLFGPTVHKALTERAETISALKKVAQKIDNRSTSRRPPGKNRQFFRPGSTSDHGQGSSRIYRPSRHKYTVMYLSYH